MGSSPLPSRRAVFLDKDGTLVVDIPYNVDPAKIELMPGTREALRLLRQGGFALVVITNQSGVAKGLFTIEDLPAVEHRLNELFGQSDVSLDGFYFCPHHPDGEIPEYSIVCECRKPKAGMIMRAAKDLGLDLSRSFMVGDLLNDVEAGHRAGCRSILLDSGGETEWLPGPNRDPDYRTQDLLDAARWILEQAEHPSEMTKQGEQHACQCG